MKEGKVRLQTTISQELYDDLKVKADYMGVSVQSLIVMYATEHIKQVELVNKMPNMIDQLKDLSLFSEIISDKQ